MNGKSIRRLELVKAQLRGEIVPNKSGWVYNFIDPKEFVVKTESLKGKTLFITGASRGIGLAIALKAAEQGANIAIVAKTAESNPKLEGTIFTAAAEIEKKGGKALAIQCDIRSEESVVAAVKKCVETFGGIDILVNNASAIALTPTSETSLKSYDLMNSINSRGTFVCTKHCLPYLKKSENPHILTISPPLSLDEKWFKNFPAYALAKYGMSLLSKGFAGEFREFGIGVNCLWPRTMIATAAVQNLLGGGDSIKRSRKPEIMADASSVILNSNSKLTTGNYFLDDEVLVSAGIKDLNKYNVDPTLKDYELGPDFFC